MKDIKFMAWANDGWHKVMDAYDVNYWNKVVKCSIENIDLGQFKFDEITLLQYTGLRDKNNKEIYEGDIVKTTYAEFRKEYNRTQITELVEQIVFIDGAFQLKNTYEGIDFFRPLCMKENEFGVVLKSIEVIGNVYENSDLLKEEE